MTAPTHAELVERVARAISGAPFSTASSRRKARAAIAAVREALREPSGNMLRAADRVMGYDPLKMTPDDAPRIIGNRERYRAMLAASPLAEADDA